MRGCLAAAGRTRADRDPRHLVSGQRELSSPVAGTRRPDAAPGGALVRLGGAAPAAFRAGAAQRTAWLWSGCSWYYSRVAATRSRAAGPSSRRSAPVPATSRWHGCASAAAAADPSPAPRGGARDVPWGVLFRPREAPRGTPPPAVLRVAVEPPPEGARITLLKSRGGARGSIECHGRWRSRRGSCMHTAEPSQLPSELGCPAHGAARRPRLDPATHSAAVAGRADAAPDGSRGAVGWPCTCRHRLRDLHNRPRASGRRAQRFTPRVSLDTA